MDPLSSLTAAIRAVAPHADAATWAAVLAPVMRSSGITTPARIAAFISQIAVESGYFTALVEDLNYSAERLMEVWPREFDNHAIADEFAHRPEYLANNIYANRLGNGSPASGDGWKFRGRGLIQITGRANYDQFAKAMHMTLDAAVTFAGTPAGAAASACWFWSARNLNAWADTWEITAITRRINPALEGAAERIALANLARGALVPTISKTEIVALPPPSQNLKDYVAKAETVSADTLMAAELASLNPAPEQS